MKRPIWATIVGIFAIIFGVFGVFSGAQEMAIPSMLKMHNEMMASIIEGTAADRKEAPEMIIESERDSEQHKMDTAMSRMFEDMQGHLLVPEWYEKWAVVIGSVSIAVAALYLISGIFLLMIKPYAIMLFYTAIGISICWATVQAIVYAQFGSGMLVVQIPGSITSVVIDLILLIVVFVGSKEAFRGEHQNTTMSQG